MTAIDSDKDVDAEAVDDLLPNTPSTSDGGEDVSNSERSSDDDGEMASKTAAARPRSLYSSGGPGLLTPVSSVDGEEPPKIQRVPLNMLGPLSPNGNVSKKYRASIGEWICE